MMIQNDVVIITIYDHEENFDELVDWLGVRCEYHKIHAQDTDEFLGYRFIMSDNIYKRFLEEFDIVSMGDEERNMFPVQIKIDDDTEVKLWEKSFAVTYKGIWSGVFYILSPPEEADYMPLVQAMKGSFLAGQQDTKAEIKRTLGIL